MSTLSSLPWYETLRQRVVPPAFLVLFTVFVQVLVRLGNPDSEVPMFNLGSAFSWKVVLAFYVWAFISLKVPAKEFQARILSFFFSN